MFGGSNQTFTNNTCENNEYGMTLQSAENNLIFSNEFRNNNDYGVYLYSSCHNNIIHHNIFYNNSQYLGSQGYDSGTNNIWYDAEAHEGNYWSDWSGSGSYAIAGTADSVDLYPLGGTHTTTQVNLLLFLPMVFSIPIFIKMKLRRKENIQ